MKYDLGMSESISVSMSAKTPILSNGKFLKRFFLQIELNQSILSVIPSNRSMLSETQISILSYKLQMDLRLNRKPCSQPIIDRQRGF